MPQGGSFGLEMLPILFIAVRRGVLPGLVAGALFGLLQLAGVAGTPYIYHPVQALLDYPLAFGALGLAGLVPVGRMDDVHNLPRLIAAVALGTVRGWCSTSCRASSSSPSTRPLGRLPGCTRSRTTSSTCCPSAIVTAICLWPLLRAYDVAFPSDRRPRGDRRRVTEARGRPVAVIFLDGEYGDPGWHRALAARADVLLAADGGARFLTRLGVTPQAVVGDFDSSGRGHGRQAARRPASSSCVIRCARTSPTASSPWRRRCAAGPVRCCSPAPPARSTTRSGTWRYSGAWRRAASSARLVAPDLTATVLIAPAAVALDAPAGTRVSLAPAGEAATVTLTGLDYPLDHGVLAVDACLGLGNHVSAEGECTHRAARGDDRHACRSRR